MQRQRSPDVWSMRTGSTPRHGALLAAGCGQTVHASQPTAGEIVAQVPGPISYFVAGVGQVLMTSGFHHGPVSRSAVPTLFVLAVATLGAWLGWGDVPDGWSWVGIVAVLVAIVWVGLTPGPTTPRPR